MSRWRESSGASLGSQTTPPTLSMTSKRLRELGEVAVVLQGAFPAHVALADERRAVDAREDHVVAADVDVVVVVARLDVELTRRLGRPARGSSPGSEHLLSSTFWPAARNRSSASGFMNSTPISDTIRRQPRSSVAIGLLGEDLVARHPVDEHRTLLRTGRPWPMLDPDSGWNGDPTLAIVELAVPSLRNLDSRGPSDDGSHHGHPGGGPGRRRCSSRSSRPTRSVTFADLRPVGTAQEHRLPIADQPGTTRAGASRLGRRDPSRTGADPVRRSGGPTDLLLRGWPSRT